MSLLHLADAVCSFLILEKCTEVPFVMDAKRSTELELYFEKKKKKACLLSIERHFN